MLKIILLYGERDKMDVMHRIIYRTMSSVVKGSLARVQDKNR